tara:strand:+ start:429 stop:830 length:402 start_codon:yes stop_codon:yes gene_type:complete
MKNFKDLDFKSIIDDIGTLDNIFKSTGSHFFPGVRAIMEFPNGYGISVIQSSFSYGGDEGLFEIGVLDHKRELTYETPITSDVIGYLTDEEVSEIMIQIQKLSTYTIADNGEYLVGKEALEYDSDDDPLDHQY